jgi:hypothetical protein
MEKIGNIVLEEGIPYVETRGRPTSDEYLALLVTKVGRSFVSQKTRHSLYQIARNLGIKVTITSAGDKGWRVYKRGKRVLRDKRIVRKKGLVQKELLREQAEE